MAGGPGLTRYILVARTSCGLKSAPIVYPDDRSNEGPNPKIPVSDQYKNHHKDGFYIDMAGGLGLPITSL